ncbi:MAG: hypothetical protein Q4D51_05830 [Eubacteriales bacterium]|nr:hypothetical protein [Eubacteriales bacterium]
MDNREVEMNIQKAFDQVSLEEISKKLEDVDPFDFQCPTELSKKRIEKDFMRRLEESNKKKTKTYKKVAYTAAALAVVVGATFTFSDSVRAAIDKMFAFVPNQGIVEVEVDNTTEAGDKKTTAKNETTQKEETQSATTQDSIYVLKDKAVKDMPNFAISMESVNIMNNKMKMIYKIDLKAVREATINEDGFSADLMVSTFKSSGMEKYCDYNEDSDPIVKKVHSSVVANGKEIQPSSSEVRFGEDSAYNAYVIEEYALADCDAANAEIALKVGDVEVPLAMEALNASNSVENAANGRFIAKNVGITLLCDTELQNDGWVYADIYVLDSGKYKAVDDVWPTLYNSDDLTDPNGYYPSARIGGQRFEGCCVAAEVFDGKNGMPFRLAFEVGNDADMSKLTVFLSDLMVEKDGGEIVRLDNDFVFGTEAADNKEQSADEAVEAKEENPMDPDNFDFDYYEKLADELNQGIK